MPTATDPKRERALNLIRTMEDLIKRPTTPEGEREAARSRVAALRKKHGITEPVKQTTSKPPPKVNTNPRPPWHGGTSTFNNEDWAKFTDDALRDYLRKNREDELRRARAKRMAEEDVKRQQEQRAKAATEAAQREAKRKMAQEDWERRMADKDAYGYPLTDEERAEAQRDPLGWAAKRDGRTTGQRNEDINSTWKHAPYTGQKRTNQEARQQAQARTNEYAKQARETDERIKAKVRPNSWDTTTKYQAKILNVEEKTSKAGNPMVVIYFVIGSVSFPSYYVLNNERGLKNLMAVVSTLLGPVATQMNVDTILGTLFGQACTVMLNSWTTEQGEEKWTVQTVLKPWS